MAASLFTSFGAVIIVATILAMILRWVRQPLIIGYLLTGILAGPSVLGMIPRGPSMSMFSEFGVAFLLFLVGIGLDPVSLREMGKVAIKSGSGQVILTTFFGFIVSRGLGFSTVPSIYIAVGLTLSSTIIVLKLLSDRNETETLHGKLSTGILIIQDLIALIALLIVSSFAQEGALSERILQTLGIGALIVAVLGAVAYYALPRVLAFAAASQEMLFLFSIGWLFLVASILHLADFSIEMGALLAGISLSLSPYRHEMSAKVKPLRDFFVLIFFILLGSQLAIGDVASNITATTVLSLFVLIGNPLIVLIIMLRLGYTSRTGFLAGITMAQVSEFSFVLLGLAVSVGHVTKEIVSVVTAVGMITIALSTLMIVNGERIYESFLPIMRWLEKSFSQREERSAPRRPPCEILLFGLNRIGHDLIKAIKALKRDVLVIDYNPSTIAALEAEKIPCLYGDANDREILNELDLSHCRMVISTIPSLETTHLLLSTIRARDKDIIFIATSHQIDEALRLYKDGASYVLLPHFLGGSFAAQLIQRHGFALRKFHREKQGHIRSLKLRKKLGHEHPQISKH